MQDLRHIEDITKGRVEVCIEEGGLVRVYRLGVSRAARTSK